jgi:hypothetical protein
MFINEFDGFVVSTTQLDGTLSLEIQYNGERVAHFFDRSNGKHFLRIADAIETAIVEQDAKHEAETFQTMNLA